MNFHNNPGTKVRISGVGLMMKFEDVVINREHRFSVGREAGTGRCYFSVPVANKLADDEESFEISRLVLTACPANMSELIALAGESREQLSDHMLLVQPGTDCGVG